MVTILRLSSSYAHITTYLRNNLIALHIQASLYRHFVRFVLFADFNLISRTHQKQYQLVVIFTDQKE